VVLGVAVVCEGRACVGREGAIVGLVIEALAGFISEL